MIKPKDKIFNIINIQIICTYNRIFDMRKAQYKK